MIGLLVDSITVSVGALLPVLFFVCLPCVAEIVRIFRYRFRFCGMAFVAGEGFHARCCAGRRCGDFAFVPLMRVFCGITVKPATGALFPVISLIFCQYVVGVIVSEGRKFNISGVTAIVGTIFVSLPADIFACWCFGYVFGKTMPRCGNCFCFRFVANGTDFKLQAGCRAGGV